MATLILKTEPFKYSFDDLLRDGKAVWDGVANAQALIVLRGAKVGDEALIYHSNEGKAIVGIAKVTRAAYPDPKLDDPKLVVIELAPVKALAKPVTLAEMKATPGLEELGLIRQSRLSCMTVSAAHRKLLRGLGVK
ncbi:MAG TPA: EVE domain-containing protein [Gemmatimonadales bacterium]|nr:EVE domain-containing protein [Gemmatimonadales bacterium]